jgi:predicted helicase
VSSGEVSRREGGKIFGGGSRTPIAISLLVKNPKAALQGQIYFHNIGDYLSREEKLKKIADYISVAGIVDWQNITPDKHGDWLNHRDDSFGDFIALGAKEQKNGIGLFINYSNGIKTQRDAWTFNASKLKLEDNMSRMIHFYNSEVARFNQAHGGLDKKTRESKVDGFIDTNPEKISWTHALKQELIKDRQFTLEQSNLKPSLYRPFTKQWLYFSRLFNERVYQMPRIFVNQNPNLSICVSAPGFISGFTAIMTDIPPELCLSAMKGGTQCFPLYLYESVEASDQQDSRGTGDMFASKTGTFAKDVYTRKDAITDIGLKFFENAYPGETISKEDLFYYVYGLLHSPDYRQRYADNLSKELPRIPTVKSVEDFWHFSKSGRDLAELHLNYETVLPYPLKMAVAGKDPLTDKDYRVDKMKYGKNGKTKDRTTIIYNHRITLSGIPLEAYEYLVNGKPALDWVVERQCVKTEKNSGIINDANDWAIETMANPKYPLELFMRVVTVSLETVKIVNSLPELDI